MTVATEAVPAIGEVIGVHVDELEFGINARYGWNTTNGNILQAYQAKNEKLRAKIEEWGFRKAHAVEFYIDDDGRKVILHGNRRTFVSKWIKEDDPDAVIAWDLPAGQIWGVRVEKPESVVQLMREQVADNEQLEATRLDQLMVYQARVDELINSGEAKTANNAIKEIAKQDFKAKAEKLIELGEAATLADAYKVLKKEITSYETTLKKELKVMSLSPEVLAWLQESYLDACDIHLSFAKVLECLSQYADKADLLLKEALKEVTLEPREEYQFNGFLSSKWLDNLAKKLGLLTEEKPKKAEKKEPFFTPEETAAANAEEGEETESDTEETGEETTEGEAPKPREPKTPTGQIQSKVKKTKEFFFKEIVKQLDSDLGMCFVDSEKVLVQEPEPGIFSVTVDLPSKQLAEQFQAFLTNLKAAFGDTDAISTLVDENTEAEAPREQAPATPNPLDDIELDADY